MTPTMVGRIQTRLFLAIVVGIPWTLLIGPVLAPLVDATVGDVYEVAFTALALVAGIGILWEFVYHQIQQYRWEKDWPTLFGLVTVVNEFIVVAIVLAALDYTINVAVWIHFGTLWLLIWGTANGPMRVAFPRWRYRGGRVI